MTTIKFMLNTVPMHGEYLWYSSGLCCRTQIS